MRGRYHKKVGTHHNVNLLLHICQHRIVRDGDPLENMVRCPINWCRGPYEVNVSKAACSWVAASEQLCS